MFADRTMQVGLRQRNEMAKEEEKNPFWGPANLKKRQYRRFSIDLPVQYWQTEISESKPCRAIDISKGGLQLYVSEKIEVGQNLKLRIFIDPSPESKPLETDIQVVWTGIDVKAGGYRMGARFVDVSLASPLLVLAKRLLYLGEWRDEYDNQLDPKFARAYWILGKIYMYKADYNQAILYFNKSIAIHPDEGEAYLYRGFTYYRKGVYEKSWEDILKARELGFRVPQDFLKNLNKASGRSKEFLNHFNERLGGEKEMQLISI